MIEVHRKLSDSEFELQFKECKLAPNNFTHEAHLRLAWIHIRRYGIETALENIPFQLQRFVQAAGAMDKYNITLTIAAIKAVCHFALKSKTETFESFIQENIELKSNFKNLLSTHYGFEIYNSQEAKRSFLAPDLLPFD